MSDQRLYLYKIVVDSGGAPCVHTKLLSLAICKPAIRRTAQPGDLIFAFGTNDESPANRLVYIAEVADRVTDGQYYTLPEFQDRPDCIYQRKSNGRFVIRNDARYHALHDIRPRDVGDYPHYQNAIVLISSDFRYFGGSGTDDWKPDCPKLTKLVEGMCQGHRVEYPAAIYDELLALKQQMWKNRSKTPGVPLHSNMEDSDVDEDTYEATSTECRYVKEPRC